LRGANGGAKLWAVAKPGVKKGQKPVTSGLYIRSARALKRRDLRCDRLTNKMYANMVWLRPEHRGAARTWAQCELLSDLIWVRLRSEGIFNETGELKRLADDWRKIKSVQLAYGIQLAMTPHSHRMLRPDVPAEALDIDSANSVLQARFGGDSDTDTDSGVNAAGSGVSVAASLTAAGSDSGK
jgi:hypothetical protein